MSQTNGLHLIHSPTDPVADIVFVHGLFGHPYETWTIPLTNHDQSNPDNGGSPVQIIEKPTRPSVFKRPFQLFTSKHKATQYGNQGTSGQGRASSAESGSQAADLTATTARPSSSETVFWPKDLLPRVVPDARIYVWGYDVDINHLFSSAGQATVFQHATTLLLDLSNERTSSKAKVRPIIFVSHSLGGIVVKDMLNASRGEVTYLKDILPATYGIIFLGTPHRGSSVASLSKIAQEITKVFWKTPNTSVLRDLEVNSQTLDRVGRGFNQILVERQLKIQSFREELPMNGVMVVNSFSSAIENGREVIGTIPANHRNMAKFSTPYDVGFIRIAATLTRWIDDIKAKRSSAISDREGKANSVFNKKLHEIRQWIDPKNFNIQLEAIPDVQPLVHDRATLGKSDVTNWLSSYGSVLNIIGQRGYGKTVLAATLITSTIETSLSSSYVGFAFCFETTPSEILRSLVWQAAQTPSLKPQQKEDIVALYREHGSETRDNHTMDQDALIFRVVLEKVLRNFDRVTIVLDGVDQSQSQDDLIHNIFFVTNRLTGASVQCRVLITSENEIRWAGATATQLIIKTVPITRDDVVQDINRFVATSLELLKPPMAAAKRLAILARCLRRAAEGWHEVIHDLATAYVHEGKALESCKLEGHALEYKRKRLREDSQPILESKRTLAIAIAELGRLSEAEGLQREILTVLKRQDKPESDSFYQTLLNDLALTLNDAEKYEEAREIQLKLAKIWEEGGDKVKLEKGLSNLAINSLHLGKLAEAEGALRRCLETAIEAHKNSNEVDDDNESILTTKTNLGQALARQGKWTEAEELERTVLDARLRNLGEDHLMTVRCMSNLAWTVMQQGKLEEAKELQLKGVAGRTKLQGARHPETLSICGNLAETLMKLGEMDEARRYARIALGY